MPTVTLMVGGIDKQIYLPYQLAKSLGMYKKYGINMKLSTETAGGVGAEDSGGLGSGRHGRRVVCPHHRLPDQGQGRHRHRPALGRPGRADHVRQGFRREDAGRLEGQACRRDRPRLGHGRPRQLRLGPRRHDADRLYQDRRRRRPDDDRRAEVRQGDLRHHQPADRERDRKARRRLFGDRPLDRGRRAEMAWRRLPGRHRAGAGRLGEDAPEGNPGRGQRAGRHAWPG